MAIHSSFPTSAYDIPAPGSRWFPADEALRESAYEKLLPPLVANIRNEISAWRDQGYPGVSSTSSTLLRWWFHKDHMIEQADGTLKTFAYYFAQREAIETVIWLYEVKQARDKYDLMRFDASGAISTGMFAEDWTRYVCKMATGAGKTKVLSLLIAWCFFHRSYEPESELARNILLIAPNIIVLDRLKADFDGLKIFFNDPVLPDNGHDGHNWRDDFQLTLHIQDDVRVLRPTGNLFLTNIHRVYLGDVAEPSLDDDNLTDYFLQPFGPKPRGKTTDSGTDLGEIVRDIDELAVFNDEAHHVHDEKMAWFKSIQDIHHRMLQKDRRLSLQLDVTATPKHNNGAIFVQTVSDYPLVEAIYQNVVKHPTLPDATSIERLTEHKSAIFTERYADYLQLGVEEWRDSNAEHEKLGKKAVLFVMVDDTKNCDEVGAHLEKIAPELEGKVLVIHTKNNGELSEAKAGKKREELEALRKAANNIDSWDSPYKAIVSVLVLKEGWDVRNVTTIVGLRAYSAKSNILPEQTLGRGLRRMYGISMPAAKAADGGSDEPEHVSVIGTDAFMEFVESIKTEGVEFEHKPMGAGGNRQPSLIVEVDSDNEHKDIDDLDIPIPKLTRRYSREFRDLTTLDVAKLGNSHLPLKAFTPEQTRDIVFKTMLDDTAHHTIQLQGSGPADYRSVVGFFARQLLKELRLVGGYDVLYPKVRAFMRGHLFENSPVNLEDPIVLRNLSEPEAAKTTFDSLKAGINAITVTDSGTSRIKDYIRLKNVRPFRPSQRPFMQSSKTIFSKVVAEANAGGLELAFAAFLDKASDVAAFTKNYLAIGFNIDYVKADGDLSNYTPDFIVRLTNGTVVIVETKGREEIDLPQKMARLAQWCADATAASATGNGPVYQFAYVDQAGFERHRPGSMAAVMAGFREFQP